MEVKDKVVVVTGGGNGIGEALCRRFAAEGAKAVTVADIDEAAAKAVAGDIGGLAIRCDVTKEEDIVAVVRETEEKSEEKKEGKVVRQERRYGKYLRSMTVGNNVDLEKIAANYTDGVLELMLPKVAAAEPKKIKVDVA